MPDRCAIAIHRRVAAAENDDLFVLHVDVGVTFIGPVMQVVHIGDEKGQCIVDTGQVFSGKTAFHVVVGAHTKKHGIVFVQQLLEGDVFAHFSVEHKLYAHTFEDFAAFEDDFFLELERRDTESQQATNLFVSIVNYRFHAISGEDVSTTKARRASAHDSDFFAGFLHF